MATAMPVLSSSEGPNRHTTCVGLAATRLRRRFERPRPAPVCIAKVTPHHQQQCCVRSPLFRLSLAFCSQPIVTGTSVLGLKYKDGVMLAADTLGAYVPLSAPQLLWERARAALPMAHPPVAHCTAFFRPPHSQVRTAA